MRQASRCADCWARERCTPPPKNGPTAATTPQAEPRVPRTPRAAPPARQVPRDGPRCDDAASLIWQEVPSLKIHASPPAVAPPGPHSSQGPVSHRKSHGAALGEAAHRARAAWHCPGAQRLRHGSGGPPEGRGPRPPPAVQKLPGPGGARGEGGMGEGASPFARQEGRAARPTPTLQVGKTEAAGGGPRSRAPRRDSGQRLGTSPRHSSGPSATPAGRLLRGTLPQFQAQRGAGRVVRGSRDQNQTPAGRDGPRPQALRNVPIQSLSRPGNQGAGHENRRHTKPSPPARRPPPPQKRTPRQPRLWSPSTERQSHFIRGPRQSPLRHKGRSRKAGRRAEAGAQSTGGPPSALHQKHGGGAPSLAVSAPLLWAGGQRTDSPVWPPASRSSERPVGSTDKKTHPGSRERPRGPATAPPPDGPPPPCLWADALAQPPRAPLQACGGGTLPTGGGTPAKRHAEAGGTCRPPPDSPGPAASPEEGLSPSAAASFRQAWASMCGFFAGAPQTWAPSGGLLPLEAVVAGGSRGRRQQAQAAPERRRSPLRKTLLERL